jgi:hypothetical protein
MCLFGAPAARSDDIDAGETLAGRDTNLKLLPQRR